MRPFRFRAWDKEKKIMIHDICDNDTQKWVDFYLLKPGDWLHPTVWKIGVLNETLMQFTGLRDRNDKDIYESDFMITDSGALAIVEWCEARLCYTLSHPKSGEWSGNLSTFGEDNKIIGNIYQNPDLLESK